MVETLEEFRLSDHELIESMKVARRLASQAQAAELAAVAELTRRHNNTDTVSSPRVLAPSEYLHDEIAQALTITLTNADELIRFATDLTHRLPGTLAALRRGDIDTRKARTIWHGTDQLALATVTAIEAAVLPKAAAQTTGQIRAKIRRLASRLAPEAGQRRRVAAERRRSVQLIATDDGTADLSGIDLPIDVASAAYGRVTAIATALKTDGDPRGIGQLRADVYLALLRGTLPAGRATEPTAEPHSTGTPHAAAPQPAPEPTHAGIPEPARETPTKRHGRTRTTEPPTRSRRPPAPSWPLPPNACPADRARS